MVKSRRTMIHFMDDEHVTDPKENPEGTGHLPVSGEVGVGPVQAHDPVTADTDDDPEHQPGLSSSEDEQPAPENSAENL